MCNHFPDIPLIHFNPHLTFRVHIIVGTGFPEGLHSRVIVPPLRAVSCPLAGDVRILGGTGTQISVISCAIQYSLY